MRVSRQKAQTAVEEGEQPQRRKSKKSSSKKSSAKVNSELTEKKETSTSQHYSSKITSSRLPATSPSSAKPERGVTEFAAKLLTGPHLSIDDIPKAKRNRLQRFLMWYNSATSLVMVDTWESQLFHGVTSVALGCASYVAYNYLASWTR